MEYRDVLLISVFEAMQIMVHLSSWKRADHFVPTTKTLVSSLPSVEMFDSANLVLLTCTKSDR